MENENKMRQLAILAVVFAVLLASASGCAETITRKTPPPADAIASAGGSHVAASALTKGPRVADGVTGLSLDAAKTRARFELRLPDSAEVPDDSTVVRVLPQGSDAGEGYYLQYKKYEVAQIPTNIEFDASEYVAQEFLLDLSDPKSGFARYRSVTIGSRNGVLGAEFAQMQGTEPIANAPAIVAWQVPAPAGVDAKYLDITVSAWDMPESKLLRVAESLNR